MRRGGSFLLSQCSGIVAVISGPSDQHKRWSDRKSPCGSCHISGMCFNPTATCLRGEPLAASHLDGEDGTLHWSGKEGSFDQKNYWDGPGHNPTNQPSSALSTALVRAIMEKNVACLMTQTTRSAPR